MVNFELNSRTQHVMKKFSTSKTGQGITKKKTKGERTTPQKVIYNRYMTLLSCYVVLANIPRLLFRCVESILLAKRLCVFFGVNGGVLCCSKLRHFDVPVCASVFLFVSFIASIPLLFVVFRPKRLASFPHWQLLPPVTGSERASLQGYETLPLVGVEYFSSEIISHGELHKRPNGGNEGPPGPSRRH